MLFASRLALVPSIAGNALAIVLVAANLLSAMIASLAFGDSRMALVVVVFGVTATHGFLVFCGIRTLGSKTELGWTLFVFGLLFWFLYPGLERLAAGEPLVVAAVSIDATHRHFVTAIIGVLVLSLMFQLGYALSFSAKVRHRCYRLLGALPISARRQLDLAMLLVAVNVVGYTVMSGGPLGYASMFIAGRTSDPVWQNVGNAGTSLTPINVFLTAIGVVGGVFAGYLALRGQLSRWRRALGFTCWLIPIGWAALASGTRSTLLIVIAPPLLLALRESVPRGGGLRLAAILGVAVLLIALTVASNVIREFRAHATFEGDIDINLKDNDLLSNAALAVAISEREQHLVMDSAVLQILTLPVPRVLWPSKPRSETVPLFTRYVWGPAAYRRGKSNLPSIVGQYLMSWGWLGLGCAGFVLGVLLRNLDDLCRHTNKVHVRLSALIVIVFVFTSFRVIGNSGASILYGTALFLWLARLRLRTARSLRRQRSPRESASPGASSVSDSLDC